MHGPLNVKFVQLIYVSLIPDYDDDYTLPSLGPPPGRLPPSARSAATTGPPCASTKSGTWFLTWLLSWVVLYSGYS